ncbi:transposase [Ideonella aquatica]|uniref:transposase n=1 Tax=Ideonella aquatica TaxID=2824119 RepID=UPI004046C492
MKQHNLGLGLRVKQTRRREFLADMEKVIPWTEFVDLVSQSLPQRRRRSPPFSTKTRLRIHLMLQWFVLSDTALEGALHDMPVLREFVRQEDWDEQPSDTTTIQSLRDSLRKHKPAVKILRTGNELRNAKSAKLVGAPLIAAPGFTKNSVNRRVVFAEHGYRGASRRLLASGKVTWHSAIRPNSRRVLDLTNPKARQVEQKEGPNRRPCSHRSSGPNLQTPVRTCRVAHPSIGQANVATAYADCASQQVASE